MMKSEEDAVEAHGVISREIIYATQLLLRNLRRNKAIWNAENSSPQDFGNMAKSAEMKFSDGLICFNEVWTLLGPLDLCVFLANTTNEDGGYCLGRIAGISTLCPNHIVLHGSLEENTFRHEVEDNCLWISFGDSKNGSLYEYKV